MWDEKTQGPMHRSAWLFTGSFMHSVTGDPADATYALGEVHASVYGCYPLLLTPSYLQRLLMAVTVTV